MKDKTIPGIIDMSTKNMGDESNQLQFKNTGTKPKREPPKIDKNQVPKNHNPGLPITIEQTSLNKKTKDALGYNTSVEMDVSAHLKENKMPHELGSNQTKDYRGCAPGEGLNKSEPPKYDLSPDKQQSLWIPMHM